jgi:DNA-binding protein
MKGSGITKTVDTQVESKNREDDEIELVDVQTKDSQSYRQQERRWENEQH